MAAQVGVLSAEWIGLAWYWQLFLILVDILIEQNDCFVLTVCVIGLGCSDLTA